MFQCIMVVVHVVIGHSNNLRSQVSCNAIVCLKKILKLYIVSLKALELILKQKCLTSETSSLHKPTTYLNSYFKSRHPNTGNASLTNAQIWTIKTNRWKLASGIKKHEFWLYLNTPMCVSNVYSVLSRALWTFSSCRAISLV